MIFSRYFLPGVLITAAALASAAPGERPETSHADPVLTSATVRGTSETVTVELQPVRPVRLLKRKLPSLPPMNAQVVETLLSYPREGKHTYYWPRKNDGVSYDGCTTDVLLGKEVVMRGESKARTFCCGLTLEVFYRVLQQQPTLPAALETTATASDFKRLWFCREINSPGPEDAMIPSGLGRKIRNHDRALPGDFVQLWRANKSGHSVIFVAWARDKTGKRVGLHYWSTQESTNGIGFHTELFRDDGKGVREDNLSVTRMLPPEKWKAPRKEAKGETAAAPAPAPQ